MQANSVKIPAWLGFLHPEQLVLCAHKSIEDMKQQLVALNGAWYGRGMEFGSFQVRLNSSQFRMWVHAPGSRRPDGPVFEGVLSSDSPDGVRLEGRFRFGYPEMLIAGILQCGLLGSAIAFLLGGKEQLFALSRPASVCLVLLGAVAVVFLPRLSWLTQRARTQAMLGALAECGLTPRPSITG